MGCFIIFIGDFSLLPIATDSLQNPVEGVRYKVKDELVRNLLSCRFYLLPYTLCLQPVESSRACVMYGQPSWDHQPET
jgi:hypothetical protein